MAEPKKEPESTNPPDPKVEAEKEPKAEAEPKTKAKKDPDTKTVSVQESERLQKDGWVVQSMQNSNGKRTHTLIKL